jgi:hypothetical protein
MSSTMVHIMLHGLIVLAPVNGENGQLNHMTALLIDATKPRIDLQCFVPHEALLIVSTSNDDCAKAGCSVNDGLCECNFADFQEISLSPDVQPAADALRGRPENSLPFNQAEATSFAYIGNLANLGQKLRPELLDLDAVPSPNPLIARMTFPFENANACSLATRPDEGGKNVHPLNFRRVGLSEKPREISQALAQVLMAQYQLPDDGTGSPPLTLTLRKPGADPRQMILDAGVRPGTNDRFYLIRLENKRIFELLPGDPCDDGVARDFGLYYELAENPPPPKERLIPHVKHTRWKGANELLAPACQGMKDPMSRPVCPIGSFYPATGEAQ